MTKQLNRAIWLWLALVIVGTGVVYGVLYSFRPYVLDDLSYFIDNRRWIMTHPYPWLRWPSHIAGMWLEVNGRLGDSSNMLWLNVIHAWMRGAIEGLCVAGLYGGTVLWLRRLHFNAAGCIAGVALLMGCLPWWDASGLYVVHINYVWPCTLLLFAFYFLFWNVPRSRTGRTVLCAAMFLTGAWHEAIGLPLIIALGIALTVKQIRSTNLWPMVWGILGGVYSTFSPGILGRMGAEHIPDDSIMPLILKTVPFAAVLLAVVLYKLVRNPRVLWEQFSAHSGRTGILTAFSLASAGVAVGSGIIGRPGWFAQVFSLLALADLCCPTLPQIFVRSRWVGFTLSVILLGLMSVQTVLTGIYQYRFDLESKGLISKYLASSNGVVVADVPDYRCAPAIVLNRAHTFPPPYDPWLQESLRKYRAAEAMGACDLTDSVIRAQPGLTIVPPELAAAMEGLDSAPDEAVETGGGVILPEGPIAVEVRAGSYPQRIEYRGFSAIVYIAIPPGSRPWNE